MQKLKILDLFSGIGGFSIGLERTGKFETIAFCAESIKNEVNLLNAKGPSGGGSSKGD